MYIQITDRCNMRCKHCCSECEKIGDDMTAKMFEKCMIACEEQNLITFIGGGEPTLHPLFDQFLIRMVSSCSFGKTEMCGCTTNGTNEEKTAFLYALSKSNVHGFYFSVSNDQFHKKIMPKNIQNILKKDPRFGKGVFLPKDVKARGRGKKIKEAIDGCVCGEIFVGPNGAVKPCGCSIESPTIANILTTNSSFLGEINDLRIALENQSLDVCFAFFTETDFFRVMKYKNEPEKAAAIFNEIKQERNPFLKKRKNK